MLTNKNITVIVPLHRYDNGIPDMLDNALKSVPKDVKIIISTGDKFDIKTSDFKTRVTKDKRVTWVANATEDTSFQNLVNLGVEAVKTDWFSILEFDDVYTPNWFENFEKYQEYNQQYNIFFPIVDLYDTKSEERKFIGYGNEAPWAAAFSETLGVIDEKSLENFFNFYPTGGIFNKKVWVEVGGLKTNIKLTFWYEFMRRFVSTEGGNIYVVPKIGYEHGLGRKDSLLDIYRSTIDKTESDFWFRTAKKESYFKEMREVAYKPKTKVVEEENK